MGFEDTPEDREESYPCDCGGEITKDKDGDGWSCDRCQAFEPGIVTVNGLKYLTKKRYVCMLSKAGCVESGDLYLPLDQWDRCELLPADIDHDKRPIFLAAGYVLGGC